MKGNIRLTLTAITAVLIILWAIFWPLPSSVPPAAPPAAMSAPAVLQVPVAVTPAVYSGESASDAYARSRGYKDWNDWLRHRPKNKEGKQEADPGGWTVVQGPTTFPVRQTLAAPIAAVNPVEQVPEQEISPETEELAPLPRPDHWHHTHGHYPPDRTVSVPEPGTLPLVAAGLLVLIVARRMSERQAEQLRAKANGGA